MTKLEQLEILKNEVAQEILNDPNRTKLEKLRDISANKLWYYDSYINGVFDQWEQECADEEERLAIAAGKIKGIDYICNLADNTFTEDMDKYTTLNFADILECLSDEKNILVATSRGKFGARIYKTREEIIDYIYNYAVENQCIGFEFDW